VRYRIGRAASQLTSSIARHPVVWGCAVTAALAGAFFATLTPTFDTNDDVGMMFIADGTYYGEPRPHLVFQHPAVGLVLSTLYRAIGGVNWYAVWLYALHAGALAVVLSLACADRRTPLLWRIVAVAGFVGVYGAWMWMHLQFTSAAMMIGAAGVLLYASAAARPRVSYGVVVGAGALVGLASFVRWRSFQAVVLLALPVVAAALRRVPWRRQAVFAGSVAGVVLSGMLFSAAYYAGDEGWRDYFEFNDVRGGIHSTAALAEHATSETAEAVGWSYTELAMFQRWFYLDEEVYTVGALADLRTELGTPAAPVSDVLDVAEGRLGVMRLVLVGGLPLVAGVVGRSRGWAITGALVVWFAAVLTGLAVFARLPERVSVPILAFLALVLVLRPPAVFPEPDPPTHVGRTWLRRAAVVAMVGVTVAGIWVGSLETAAASRRASADRSELAVLLDDLAEVDGDGVYLSWADSVTASRASPESVPSVPVTLLPLGWHQRSPMHADRMLELGITDLYLSLASDPNVYLPSARTRPHPELFADYMAEHYGFEGVLRPVAVVGPGSGVFLFDLLVDYRLDGEVLVETTPAGTPRVYPVDPAAGYGRYRTSNDGSRAAGFAVALDPSRSVDLLVALDTVAGGVMGVNLPTMTRPTRAEEYGTPDRELLGFAIRLDRPDDARVFAIASGRAFELVRVP
jgi:hypothetical protein